MPALTLAQLWTAGVYGKAPFSIRVAIRLSRAALALRLRAPFTVRVTVTWRVTWAGAGGSGTVPGLTTTGTVSVRVAESQAVIAG